MRTIKILSALLMLFPIMLVAQTKVAVYVMESSDIDDGVRKIVGSEMVSAMVKSNNYQAVERTTAFLNQLSKEQNQNSDQHISEIGKQLGVDNVCVIDITSFQSSYYVQARLLDVDDALVLSAAREVSQLSNIEDIISSVERIASKLIGGSPASSKISTDVVEVETEYSVVGSFSSTTRNLHFVSIESKNGQTVVSFKYCIAVPNSQISISPETYLLDIYTNKKFYLQRAEGIAYAPQVTNLNTGGIYSFKLYFTQLPSSTSLIDFIEPNGWCAYNISLRPFGKQGYHVFVDESEANLAQLVDEYNRLQDSYSNLVESIENLTSYNLKVLNKKLSPRAIYIKNQYIGVVNGRSERTFKVDIKSYGSCRTVQTSGYLISPSEESYTIPKPHVGQTITLTID